MQSCQGLLLGMEIYEILFKKKKNKIAWLNLNLISCNIYEPIRFYLN